MSVEMSMVSAVGASTSRIGHPHAPRSLIISPNLDALLEYDERIRRKRARSQPESCARTSATKSSASTSDEPVIQSLPLPPRGPRRNPRSPISPQVSPQVDAAGPRSPLGQSMVAGSEERLELGNSDDSTPSSPIDATSGGWSPSNPYINPPPFFPGVLESAQTQVLRTTPPRTSSMLSVDVLPRIREDSLSPGGIRPPRDSSPTTSSPGSVGSVVGDGRSGMSDGKEDSKQPSHLSLVSQQSVTPVKGSSLPKVDKLLRQGRNAFGLFSDGQKTESREVSPLSSPISPSLRKRARSRGKLVKPRDSLPKADTEMQIAAADIAQTRNEDLPRDETTEMQFQGRVVATRPLLSHGRSGSSSSSSTVMFSDTTHGPPSTSDEARISISSTIYPSSSGHSHYYYNNIPPPLPTNTLPHRSSSLASRGDRESFIDLFSPDAPEFTFNDDEMPSNDHARQDSYARSHSPKPPLPTTPKPYFGSRTSPNVGLKRSSPRSSSSIPDDDLRTLPPTTNYLNPDERAELVRRTRKLAKVFGQTPGATAMAQQDLSRTSFLEVSDTSRNRHLRGAASVSNDFSSNRQKQQQGAIWPPPEDTQYLTASGRRHSSPMSPDEFSFLHDPSLASGDESRSEFQVEIGTQEGVPSSDWSVHRGHVPERATTGAASPVSFIDLSEEEGADDGVSAIISPEFSKKVGRRRAPSSTASLFENMTPDEQAEEERRRKRDKLAKLHRFLGSRVPANLVLGLDDSSTILPPPTTVDTGMDSALAGSGDASPRDWLRRRRSSSAAAISSSWADDMERLNKEDLNDREKAINVRRAVKMEKVFGVAPPQTLYHTRHAPSASVQVGYKTPRTRSAKPSPTRDSLSSPPLSPRNPNQSSYKPKSKKNERPSTAESSKQLLPKGRGSNDYDDPSPDSSAPRAQRGSLVYSHYQHSLNSLNDILDRDDKESLAELHQYLNTTKNDVVLSSSSPPLQEFAVVRESTRDRRASLASVKSERRHSLPARTSSLSLASEYSISAVLSPKPEVTDFQMRRRRAAKLTQFFGVDYRDLIRDVLDSIENGLEHERKRGTINPEEAEDLLQKLRNIKTKRDGIL